MFIHFRGSRPCSYVGILEEASIAGPAPASLRSRRVYLLWELIEFAVLTKKLAGFGPLQRQVGR